MGLYRKVLRIRAQDSPNVRYALAEIAAGKTPSGKMLVPGVMSWEEYSKRRQLWSEVDQCIGLDAEFWAGDDVLMYPKEWLDRAERYAIEISPNRNRKAIAIGCDPAEGGDDTCWCGLDEHGIVFLHSMKTSDTTTIVDRTIELIREHGVEPGKVMFDRGGGGKQHADRLRRVGYRVSTVAFGESATPPITKTYKTIQVRTEEMERQRTYKNRRAEMYHMLRLRLEPSAAVQFAIPGEYKDLRYQLSKIPLLADDRDRIYLPPKQRQGKRTANSEKTLTEMIGRSPDQADALVVAVYARDGQRGRIIVGTGKRRQRA